MTFYDRVNEQLRLQNKTRKELSEQSGISYSTLQSLFARQSKNIGIETIRLISKFLGVSADYLITGEEPFLMYVSETDASGYQSTDKKMVKEIIRIFNEVDIQSKTRLLSTAYELESKLKSIDK